MSKSTFLILLLLLLLSVNAQAQFTSIRYPAHQSVVASSFFENDTLYLNLGNAVNITEPYQSTLFLKQVKVISKNGIISIGNFASSIDTTVPASHFGQFYKKDSLYFGIGGTSAPQQWVDRRFYTYVGTSPIIDSIEFLSYRFRGALVKGIISHPANDSLLLIFGGIHHDTLGHLPFIMKYNLYTRVPDLLLYRTNANYFGIINDMLYDPVSKRYILATTVPLIPNIAKSTMAAFAYLDSNLVLDTINQISQRVDLTYPWFIKGVNDFRFATAMEWANDSSILMVGTVSNAANPSHITAKCKNHFDLDVVSTLRKTDDFSELGTSQVYGKVDTADAQRVGRVLPLVRMDSNLFVNATTVELDIGTSSRPWHTELSLLGLDASGKKHWLKYYSFNDYCSVENLYADDKGGLWVVAQCVNDHFSWNDWFVKVMYIDSVAHWPRIGTVTAVPEAVGSSADLVLYPNPSSEEISIALKGRQQDLTVIIYDVSGREVKRTHLFSGDEKIKVQDLPAGLYVVKVHQEEKLLGIKKLMLR